MTVTLLAACGNTTPPTSPSPHPSASPAPTAAPAGVEGTVVRFTGSGTAVDVTVGADTPTTRDFLSLLPLTVELEDLNGREKVGYPPRELDVHGTPGSDPEDGDLVYFTPWGTSVSTMTPGTSATPTRPRISGPTRPAVSSSTSSPVGT